MIHVGWPQGIWIGLAILSLIMHSAFDGEPMDMKWSLSKTMLRTVLGGGLLYWGGFFT